MDIEEAAQQIRDEWNNKTLAEFRIEAERETSGMVYESFGLDAGQRLVIILCLTDIDQIQTLEHGFELRDDEHARRLEYTDVRRSISANSSWLGHRVRVIAR